MRGSRRGAIVAAIGLLASAATLAAERPPAPTGPLLFRATAPCRLLDTRVGGGAIQDGEVRTIDAWGHCHIPEEARALYLQVTALDPSAAGDLQVWGDASDPPAGAVLDFGEGATIAGAALVNLDSGSLSLRLRSGHGGAGHVLLDVVGYFAEGEGASYYGVAPCRLLDTRRHDQGPALADKQQRHVSVAGSCRIPDDALSVAAVITATEATGSGYLDVRPAPSGPPGTVAIIFDAGQARANGTVVVLGSGGFDVSPAVASGGTVHVTIDVTGYYR
jgi:hypothetical protein